jgi:2-iminobutanoate/2-iminopropanoate deaminase
MDELEVGRAEILDSRPVRDVIATESAPAAVGPYSQAIRAGHMVFSAGQLGLDPTTRKLVEGGVRSQTRQALTNLGAILEAAGSSLDQALKVTVFVTDMDDFQAINEVYAQFFPQDPPARMVIQVAALPLGGLVAVEAIALR